MAKMHRNKSVMKHNFAQVPRAEIPRSTFDRSHGHKTTFDAGYLIPVLVDEALPGDTFSVNMTAFARLTTPIFPVMDNIFIDSFFFAVPIRLIWDNWLKFNGEQNNPGDSVDYLVPQMVSPVGGYAAASMSDYFGIPTGIAGLTHSSLWHRAYNAVFNAWFRDENLINSLPVPKGDGPDDPTQFPLQRRGKRFDYFTSCLPWPQKGPGVTIPLGTSAPVVPAAAGAKPTWSGNYPGSPAPLRTTNAVNSVHVTNAATASADLNWGATGLIANLSGATAATINSLRQAFQIQKIYERDARGGTRYVEQIKSHFGVTSPDFRLARPEFLGGGSMPVNIMPVPQTSASDPAATPQGHLAAVGTALANGHGFTMSFTEHCVILGLVSARADLTYQQGLNRMFSRRTRFDFYWPALAHIGEQAVLRKEIFATGVSANDDTVFGYNERYAEMRYKPSQISGLFRSSHPQTLDAWHLSQSFASAPVLDAAFITEDPPIDRVVAVTDEPHFIMDTYFKMQCARPMPTYGVPGMIDHF